MMDGEDRAYRGPLGVGGSIGREAVDEASAKEALHRRANRGVALGVPPAAQHVMANRKTPDLASIHSRLGDIYANIRGISEKAELVGDRLYGPQPQEAGVGAGIDPVPDGALPQINEMVTMIERALDGLRYNVDRISDVA